MIGVSAPQDEARIEAFSGRVHLQENIILLSANRPFAHEESAYDTQYDLADLDTGPGNRLTELLVEQGISEGARLLEIGCGSGLLSVGLAAAKFYGELMVTDGSMSFMKLARSKLRRLETNTNLNLAVLTDVDTDRIADGYFDVIAMRSVLHHVTDFGAFATLLLRKLKPGGVLAVYEPRAEMFLWMGTVVALFPAVAAAKSIEITPNEKASLDLFVATMEFYLRRDIDKSAGEDKYAFWTTEILDIAAESGARTVFRSELSPDDLLQMLLDYALYCMAFSPALVRKMNDALGDLRSTLSGFLQGQNAPDLAGWYLLVKPTVQMPHAPIRTPLRQ